jgi:uncharacterized protein
VFAAWMRWLHIYLSMASFAVVLFFSVTGITLNHPDWFYDGAKSENQFSGVLPAEWVAVPATDAAIEPDDTAIDSVARLEIVEHLRARHAIQGAMAEFRIDDAECTVSFKGPGYLADAVIDRETGQYAVAEVRHGAVAVLNDLHKGRDTGRAWSLVIDVSAVLMTFVSLTGLVLIFYLKLRRRRGLLTALAGAIAVILIYAWLVP